MNARTLLTLAGFASVAVLIGQITVDADPGGGTSFRSRSASGPAPIAGGGIGPDVVVWRLSDIKNWGTEGDITAFSVGTVSCNIGDEELSWRDSGPDSNKHPVIGGNLYRLKDGRFEQLGQSWLKHGFCALDGNECLGCQTTFDCDWLGVGCSDPYSAWLNGQHVYLGPKSQVNPFTGEFPFPHPTPPTSDISGRLQVHLTDMLPADNPGAIYWLEGHYVTPDDAQAGNGYNNVSYRGINVLNNGNLGSWWGGGTVQETPAIFAWDVVDPQVSIVQIDVPGDGRLFLGYKATDLDNGYWQYEYALYNMNSERAVGSFLIPVSDLLDVLNDGFHDVDYHSGEPFDGTDWGMARNAGTIVWATESFAANENANAVRSGTLYNFRFQADAPPVETEVQIGLFKPGSPDMMMVTAMGPEEPVTPCEEDLDGDGTVGAADLLSLLVQWGTDPGGPPDFDGDGTVGASDLLQLLVAWGPCP